MRSDIAKLAVHHADLQKAASMQAMLADIFCEKCGHFWPKKCRIISGSQPRELFNLG
jgi:hypothetical protein